MYYTVPFNFADFLHYIYAHILNASHPKQFIYAKCYFPKHHGPHITLYKQLFTFNIQKHNNR